MQETTIICDRCGKEIKQEKVEEEVFRGGHTLHISRFGEGAELDMYKDLCDDCAKKVYKKLQEFDWQN